MLIIKGKETINNNMKDNLDVDKTNESNLSFSLDEYIFMIEGLNAVWKLVTNCKTAALT